MSSRRPGGARPGLWRPGLLLVTLVTAGASVYGRSGGVPAEADPWLEREPYEVPFADRAAWLEFMAEGAVDTAALAGMISEEEFGGLVSGSLATIERGRFPSGSLTLRGILARPFGDGPFPAVVYARGGNREYGRLRFLDVVRIFTRVRAGAAVLAPEYRGENGSDGSPELAAGDVDDLFAAVDALGAWEDADTTGATPGSALHAVDQLAPTPILRIHGAEDAAVHPSGTLAFSSRLVEAGHPHRLLLLEDAGHDLTSHAAEVLHGTSQWLSRQLPGVG